MSQLTLSIGVVGLGNWGTALGHHLAAKGHTVLGWSKEQAIVSSINEHHQNALYLKNAVLNQRLRATTDLTATLKQDVILLAVPSVALDTISELKTIAAGKLVVSAIKGLEHARLQTPLQFLAELIGAPERLAVISGPSFAVDVVAHRPVGLVAASKSEATARTVAELFTADWLRAYVSTDPIGVELGGVVKNVIAVAAGVCDGLDFGESARAGLITRGLAEMTRLAVALGADARTLSGLSGLGDLAMTATSKTSRNYTVGYRLGKGEKLGDIIATIGSVAEGVSTTPLVIELGLRHGVELPISSAVSRLLSGSVTAVEMARALISRPIKGEF